MGDAEYILLSLNQTCFCTLICAVTVYEILCRYVEIWFITGWNIDFTLTMMSRDLQLAENELAATQPEVCSRLVLLYQDNRLIYASAVLGIVILSVRPSVCPSHACFVTKRKNIQLKFLHHMKG